MKKASYTKKEKKLLDFIIDNKIKFKLIMTSNSFPELKHDGFIIKNGGIEVHLDKDKLERFVDKWQWD